MATYQKKYSLTIQDEGVTFPRNEIFCVQSISAKGLENHTGEVLRQVGGGAKVLITKGGERCAILSLVLEEDTSAAGYLPYARVWTDIEKTLDTLAPQHETWEQAMLWLGRRG